ncbi:MAG: hypothetical protein AAF821_13815 [Cyanobacteria bacterium P01_D01_bin.156]
MQRLLLVLLITTGAVSLGGCGLFGGGDDDVATEDPVIEAAPTAVQPAGTSDGLPAIPEGEDPDAVAISANSPTILARDLIQSTDPNERAIGVERTRPDPFAGLTIPLVPPQPIEVEGSNNGGGTTASQANGGAAASNNNNNAAGNNERPTIEAPRQVGASTPEIAELPAPPQPTTAQAVRVSGVVQVGGSPYAIIKAPDETERYVRQGERVANGRVLVQQIDVRSAEPRVVLLENGIPVERFVTSTEEEGVEEAPPQPSATVSTIGALPVLPSPGI